MNKSAIIETNTTGANMPDKLAKMKERVRRDRSANTQANDENNRDTSLYGRKKQTQDITKETQKLRETYNQHRKMSNRS